jgi:hypothetical protein
MLHGCYLLLPPNLLMLDSTHFLEDLVAPSVLVIDYRCDDGRFALSASCVTISNPDLLSSSEKVINPGIRSWKKHLSE